MCQCHPAASCVGCSHAVSRRGFLKGIGVAAAAGAIAPRGVGAEEPKQAPVRVGLVFLSNSAEREIWPYPGFDCEGRHQEIIKALSAGCPGIEFVPVVVKHPNESAKAIALSDSVDGYLLYTLTLNWGLTRSLGEIARLGKPTLVADEFLGGSGVFLTGYSGLARQKVPVGAVSSTKLDDLVTVARLFGGVKKPGVTAESFARECDAAARRTFAPLGSAACSEDKVPLTEIGRCVQRMKQARFVIVGAGQPGQEREFLGAKGIYVGFDELRALYDKVDRDQAAEWGRRWSREAAKVVEPTADWIAKAGAVYLASLELLKKYGTDSITMNCLGGFGSGQLPAYPCLGFKQILDDGGQGVCEAMPDDSVSMLLARILTGRSGYVSDPAIDTSLNRIVYSHCMAHTRAFGPQGPASPFQIRTLHNRDPRGCCAESFLPEGYLTTSFRTSVGRKQMVLHQARTVGSLRADRGCRTQLLGEVRGDVARLMREWDRFGWHRVTVYGDLKEPLVELGKALGLEVIEEA